MPQTVYKQVTSAEGNVTFEPVEVPTQEELDNAVTARKLANDQAAKQRHELNALKAKATPAAQADEGEEEGSQPEAKPAKVEKSTPAALPDEETIVNKAVERLTAQTEAKSKKDAEIKALLTKHGLPDTYAGIISGSADPAATAATLGADRLTFAPAQSGSIPKGDALLSIAVRSFRSMGMRHPDDPDQS